MFNVCNLVWKALNGGILETRFSMSFASRTQNSKRSRYHIFKTSPTRQLLIADSQARHPRAGNLNVLSLPGASVRHFYN